jgi:ankyrin repeat protein
MADRTELDDYILGYSTSGQGTELIGLLKKYNIDKDTINDLPKDSNNATILHSSCKWGAWGLVVELCKRGADVNAVDNENATPLHRASLIGHSRIIETLCKIDGIDTNIIMKGDHPGATPLMFTAWKCDTISVELLLRKGAGKTINSVDKSNGYTALHYAADNRNGKREAKQIMDLLIAAGADEDIRSKVPELANLNPGNIMYNILGKKGATASLLYELKYPEPNSLVTRIAAAHKNAYSEGRVGGSPVINIPKSNPRKYKSRKSRKSRKSKSRKYR